MTDKTEILKTKFKFKKLEPNIFMDSALTMRYICTDIWHKYRLEQERKEAKEEKFKLVVENYL